jgi:hypothetical protein
MGLISGERLILRTKLSLDEAVLQLSQAMKPDPARKGYSLAGFAFDNLGRYDGEVDGDGFRIHRMSWSSQTGGYVVRGDFKVGSEGVEINIKLSLHMVVKLFAAIWYAIIIYLLVASATKWIRSGSFNAGILVAPVMGIYFYALTLFGWIREKEKAKRFLRALYNG